MLKKILSLLVLLSLFVPVIAGNSFLSSSGKIVGKIIDTDSKEPLTGATVLIVGTSMGAVTNVSGEFIIVNIPPGTYSIRASYVSYSDLTIENVCIYSNLTAEVNFSLRNKVLQTSTVTVVAQRQLINKNQTNATSIIKAEDIENLPVRTVQGIVATKAGVVSRGDSLFVRGSRSDAIAFYVDGVLINDPVLGGSSASIISTAIEEIQFQSGGYTAEYGGANAGIISTTLRTGAEDYKFSFEGITDNFVSKTGNREMLGGYSYGYSELVLTAGGPIIPDDKRFKFFVAGSNNFQRSPARFWEGIDMKGVVDPSTDAAKSYDLYYPKGYLLNAASQSYRVQGNLTADLKEEANLQLKLSGTYNQGSSRAPSEIAPVVLDLFNVARNQYKENYTATMNLRATYLTSSTSFLDLNISYFNSFRLYSDYDMMNNLYAYGDSAANAKYGYNFRADGTGPAAIMLYGNSFNAYGTSDAAYQKRGDVSFDIKADYFYQLGKNHEIKAGYDYKKWTIRRYSYAYVNDNSLYSYSAANPDYTPDRWYYALDNYGYDNFGNISNSTGSYAPKKPVFIGAYIQDKMEFNDLVVNLGLRYDYINSDSKVFDNPHNIAFTSDGIIDQNHLIKVEPLEQISPRLGFSFSLTDKAKFHAQYGKFIQQTRLRDIYQGFDLVSSNIKGGLAIKNPVGFGLRPERTTQYDLGFSQQVGENLALDVTAFYKDIKDQVQIRSVYADFGAQHGGYYAFVNGDFSTTKGIEFQVDLRRTERVSAMFNYTFSDARGTGSNPSSGFRAIWQSPTTVPYFPQQVFALDFNETHRGTINIDYRFIGDDGPAAMHNSGLNLMLSYNSGHNFTKTIGYANGQTPQETLNESATPWVFQVDLRIDKSIKISGLNTNIYLLIINVLNTKNVIDVFPQTGTTNDGYLATADGKQKIKNYGDKYAQNYIDLYNAVNNSNADIYGTPRQIRLGFKIEY